MRLTLWTYSLEIENMIGNPVIVFLLYLFSDASSYTAAKFENFMTFLTDEKMSTSLFTREVEFHARKRDRIDEPIFLKKI